MPGKHWSLPERRSLIRQVKEGKTLPELRIPGRSPAAINNQRQRLRRAGLLASNKTRRIQLWTTRELMILRRSVRRFRMSATQIARAGLLPRHTKDSISQQMRRQRLGDRQRRLASQLAHRLDRRERAALERFLKTKGRKLASKEVAKRFAISPKTVTAYRRRLDLRLSWHEARSSAEYQQRMEQVRRAVSRQNRMRWQRWRAARRLTLEELQKHLERKRPGLPRRRCERCGTRWFETKQFFRVTKRRRSEVVSHSIARTCLACQAEEKATAGEDR